MKYIDILDNLSDFFDGFFHSIIKDDVVSVEMQSEHARGYFVYSNETLEVFEVKIIHQDRPYIWRSDKQNSFYDVIPTDDEHIELDVEQDVLEKASAILNGREYDKRVIVTLDLSNEEFLALALAAHKLDITLNDFINMALSEALDSIENESKD